MNIYTAYAKLLLHYSLGLKEKEKLFIHTTTLAEPLVKAIYKEAIQLGAIAEVDLIFNGKTRILVDNAINDEQFAFISPNYKTAIEEFDTYLFIKAPFNLRDEQNVNRANQNKRQLECAPYRNTFAKRTASGALRRSYCQYPTQAAAQEAGMSLDEYETFVYEACMLHKDDPIQAWTDFGKEQQKIADYLNKCKHVKYIGEDIDISFSCEGRNWINSAGTTNMPSGEVFTSPVEDSVNGVIRFGMPAIFMGNEVEDVTLWVENGYIEKWEAKRGKPFLDYVFTLPGARYFGEVAIGNNYNIQQFTKNILFDEKIGGTIHMAVGQSYEQAGGKNVSSIHWDMIADMRNGGEIYADGEKIYANGHFLIHS